MNLILWVETIISRSFAAACPGATSSISILRPPYWHTPEDTLDKVDPRSLAIVGHVLVETLPALEKKFR